MLWILYIGLACYHWPWPWTRLADQPGPLCGEHVCGLTWLINTTWTELLPLRVQSDKLQWKPSRGVGRIFRRGGLNTHFSPIPSLPPPPPPSSSACPVPGLCKGVRGYNPRKIFWNNTVKLGDFGPILAANFAHSGVPYLLLITSHFRLIMKA